MGEAKIKRQLAQNGNQMVPEQGHKGNFSSAPPTVNTGGQGSRPKVGKGGQSGADRYRINTTLPQGIYETLEVIAKTTGKSLSQVALGAIEDGLSSQVEKAKCLLTKRQ